MRQLWIHGSLGGLAAAVLLLAPACREPDAVLIPGTSRSATLAGGEALSYRLSLEQGEIVEIEILQQGIDVAVSFLDPDGGRLVEVDGWLGSLGVERVLWLAERPGRYRLEIRSHDAAADPGSLTVRAEKPRPATERDRRRAAAAAAFYGAKRAESGGRIDEARAGLERSADLWRGLAEAPWLAEVYHARGHLELFQGQLEAALEAYGQALAHAGDDTAMRARTLVSIGDIHRLRNRIERAREAFQQALELFAKTPDRGGEALAANNLGYAHKQLREVGEALRYYQRALELWRERGDREAQATALHNLGWAYAYQGKNGLAEEHFRQALAIWQAEAARQRRAGDEPQEEIRFSMARTLGGLGDVALREGRLDEALAHLEQALDLRGSHRRGRAAILRRMGEVHAGKGEGDEARRLYDEALALFREARDRRGEAATLQLLGALEEASDPRAAIGLYRQALAFSLDDPDSEAASHFGLARAERRRGDPERARRHMETAVATIEELRRQPAGDDLRASYFAGKQGYFDFYVDLLMELAERRSDPALVGEALAVSERARARSLLDSLAERGTDVRGDVDPRLVSLERQLEARRYELTRLRLRRASDERIEAVKLELEGTRIQLQALRAEIRERHPVYAALSEPRPLTAAEIQSQILEPDTLFLEYQLGTGSSFLWAVTTDSLESFELPPQERVEELARRAYALLNRSYRRQYRAATEQALAELSEMLLQPVAHRLDRRRLLIVAEGALQYVPFAALPSPAGGEPAPPLVAGHEVVGLPSASILSALRRQTASREPPTFDVAVLADPVFDLGDPRLAGARRAAPAAAGDAPRATVRDLGDRLPPDRLRYAGLEAKAILEHAAGGHNLLALDFDASKERVANGELGRYRYVHIATHGLLDPEFPDLSSLVFSLVDSDGRQRDGFLYTDEVYRLDLRADLVALSACQTARGREVRGEGIVGWTQGFLYSGARRVLVSLWNVDDQATAELMRHFYRHLLKEQRSPAAALRLAQDAIRRQTPWRMPYYWAGFVLQGEYR